VRIEGNRVEDEPPLNVYHYGIGQKDANGYPVYGPVKDKTVAPHWSELQDLDVYNQQPSENDDPAERTS
jgi:hypothetical protein